VVGEFKVRRVVCNQGRFRLSEEHFRAELLSLAKSVAAAHTRQQED
jgi:hypothetical protein